MEILISRGTLDLIVCVDTVVPLVLLYLHWIFWKHGFTVMKIHILEHISQCQITKYWCKYIILPF